MNNYPNPYENKNQALLISVRNLQRSIHLCCELLPLIPKLKNMSNIITMMNQFTKED